MSEPKRWRLAAAEPYLSGASHTTSWEVGQRSIATADSVVLATIDERSGRPHAVPVLSAWEHGGLFVAMSPSSQKARNLHAGPRCTVTLRSDELDVVVEATATRVTDTASLREIASAYADQHGWDVAVRDGMLDDTQGAPTAGSPPYEVREMQPSAVLGFPLGGQHVPTRWRFETAG